MKKETSGIIYKLLNVLCIVLVGLVTKSTMNDLSAFQTFFLSCISSLIFLMCFIKLTRQEPIVSHIKSINKNFLYIAAVNCASFSAHIHSLKTIDFTIVTAIAYISPIIVALLGIFLLKENYSFKTTIALVVSLIGTFIITEPMTMNSMEIIGLIYAFISAIGWAIHTVLLKKQTSTHWTKQSFLILTICIIIAAPFAIATWKPLTCKHIEFLVLLGVLYTINKMFLLKALARARLVLLAPIKYTKLIFAAILSYVLLGEVINFNTIIGSTLIIFATILVIHSTKNASDTGRYKI
jgi:drug/metabolite transporter (DMT)-like permease